MSTNPSVSSRLAAAGPERLVAAAGLMSVVALAATLGYLPSGLAWIAAGLGAGLLVAAGAVTRRRWRAAPILGGIAGALIAGVPIARHVDDFGWFMESAAVPAFLGGGAAMLWIAPWIAGHLGRHRRTGDLTPWQRLMADRTGDDELPPDRVSQRRVATVSCLALVAATWPLGWLTADNDMVLPDGAIGGYAVLVLVLGLAALPLIAREIAARRRLLDLHKRALDRQTVGAHLHDSVLQTLALIQRTDDVSMVRVLARQQERDLRRWLAGREELAGEQLAPALRAVAADVEDEYAALGAEIEVVTVADIALDDRVAAVVWATREALRNAVRHGGGAAHLYAEVKDDAVIVWVRDEGRGFSVGAVPTARRGVRDAIIGRMQHAGGLATISSGDAGTEVQIVLPIAPAAAVPPKPAR